MATSITNVRTQYDVLEESHGEGNRGSRVKSRKDVRTVLAALSYGVFSPVHIELGVEDGFPCLPDVPI